LTHQAGKYGTGVHPQEDKKNSATEIGILTSILDESASPNSGVSNEEEKILSSPHPVNPNL